MGKPGKLAVERRHALGAGADWRRGCGQVSALLRRHSNGGIVAFKLKDAGGKLELMPAWLSVNMMTSEPPVVANGVVFVLAAGEYTGQANDEQGGLYSAADRIKRSVPAKLFALDGVTGKQLYSSGDQVTSFFASGRAINR